MLHATRDELDTIGALRYRLGMTVRPMNLRVRTEVTPPSFATLLVALLAVLLPRITAAQAPAARIAPTASISGVVFDSLVSAA